MSEVTIVFALERGAITKNLPYDEGETVATVLDRLGAQIPDYHVKGCQLCSYGNKLRLEDVINEGTRIEIVRPLLISPTEARRLRAMRGTADRESQRGKK